MSDKKEEKLQEYCFTCPCEGQTFFLRPDAKIQCTGCGTVMERLIWSQYFTSPNSPKCAV